MFEIAYAVCAIIIVICGILAGYGIRNDKGHISGKDLFWILFWTPVLAFVPYLNFLATIMVVILFLFFGVEELDEFKLFQKK